MVRRCVGIITMPSGPIRAGVHTGTIRAGVHTGTIRAGVRIKDNAFISDGNVAWFTDNGIDIVPIPFHTKTPERYMNRIHGLYLQGGPEYEPRYMALVGKLLRMAVELNRAGTHFPVWGTCHGFQSMVMEFGGIKRLEMFDSGIKYMSSIRLTSDAHKSHIIQSMTDKFIDYLQNRKGFVYFTHNYGISPKRFYSNPALVSIFNVLSTTVDRKGKEYVSMIEARNLPFYGTQFHPEMEPFRDFFIKELLQNTRKILGCGSKFSKTFRRKYPSTRCKSRKNGRYNSVLMSGRCYFF